ncbi:MAG: hypothetical protein WKF94_02820 [Solirubrobacteraceae bacterium]
MAPSQVATDDPEVQALVEGYRASADTHRPPDVSSLPAVLRERVLGWRALGLPELVAECDEDGRRAFREDDRERARCVAVAENVLAADVEPAQVEALASDIAAERAIRDAMLWRPEDAVGTPLANLDLLREPGAIVLAYLHAGPIGCGAWAIPSQLGRPLYAPDRQVPVTSKGTTEQHIFADQMRGQAALFGMRWLSLHRRSQVLTGLVEAGEIVGLGMDLAGSARGHVRGRAVSTTSLPARLAARTGAKLVVFGAARIGTGFAGHVSGPVSVPAGSDWHPVHEQMLTLVDELIARHPAAVVKALPLTSAVEARLAQKARRRQKRQRKAERATGVPEAKITRRDAVLARRGAFFDSAAKHTRIVSVTTPAATLLVDTDDRASGRALFAARDQSDVKQLSRVPGLWKHHVGVPVDAGRDTLVHLGADVGTLVIGAVAGGVFARARAVESDQRRFNLLAANVALNALQGKVIPHHPQGSALEELVAHDVIEPAATALLWIGDREATGPLPAQARTLLSQAIPLMLEFRPPPADDTDAVALLRELIESTGRRMVDLGDPLEAHEASAIDGLPRIDQDGLARVLLVP